MARTRLAIVATLSVLVALYAIGMYGFGPGAERLHPAMRANFELRPLGIGLHIAASTLALLLGPLQFSTRLRARWPALHRWTGRVYLGGAVLLGGLAGLYMSAYAHGGPVSVAGFAGLALGWLYTGARAYGAIRAGDVVAHRRWMVRNFALSFAAVTLRLYLPWVFVLHLDFDTWYRVIAWACWVPNLLFAQWWLGRERRTRQAAMQAG